TIFEKEEGKFHNYAHDPNNPGSLMHNSIWAIYRDNVGSMWLGILNKGINKWDKYQSKFDHFSIRSSSNALSNNNVTCFSEDDNGNVWIGTDGGGLNYFDRKTNQFEYYMYDPHNPNSLGSNAVTALTEDSKGQLWVGTWEGGLSML